MNKHRFLTSSLRKVKEAYKRFLSLILLALLGVGFFAGIKATGPDMHKTIDNYFDKHKVYDLKLSSNYGFTNKDINYIKKIDNIDNVKGTYTKDKIILKDTIIRFINIDNSMNKIYIEKGRIAKNKNEVVVEQSFLDNENLKIGDYVDDLLITGTVISPLYLIKDRGVTNIGNGKINYYMYTTNDYFDNYFYSNIYITLKNTKKELTNSKNYKKEIKKVKKEIKLENITISDRASDTGYNDYVNAYESITKIGNVFPVIFYMVAILISLISMMRMIEEDRNELGCLKALGFSNNTLISRYLIYSLVATVIGGLIGVCIGMHIIPTIILNIYYNNMFYIPYKVLEFNVNYALLGIIVAIICISGSTLYVAITNLLCNPATLMNEKAPKIGKKILLERIPFIWKKLNFSNKVTIRNIFRYKSKMLVTIIGVAGSTSLVLIGFGLSDTVKGIAETQYSEIFLYDRLLYIKGENIDKTLKKYDEIEDYKYILMDQIDVRIKNNDKEVILISPKNTLKNEINLLDINTNKPLKLEKNKIIITEKLHEVYNLEIGDTIKLNNKKIEISAITKNYIYDYIYCDNETYNSIFGNYNVNAILLNNKENVKEDFNKILIKENDVLSITTSKDTFEAVNEMIKSLDKIMLILIVSAALLTLVIMYNLANINISERKREIATLKVLGFYDKEVDDYIIKETTILTIFGIILGLILGYYLSFYLISTCEPSMLLFKQKITIPSYLISVFIVILFMIIVNVIIHNHLKKIDMIESLKCKE